MAQKKDFEVFLQGRKLPVCVLEEKWHKVFALKGKPEHITVLEEKLTEMVERQEALDAEHKWLEKESLVVSPLTGFNPDTGSIKTELAQRDQLYDEQGKLLLAGITNGDDVDTAVQKYIDSQKAAGLDAIMSFMQGEADKYVAK